MPLRAIVAVNDTCLQAYLEGIPVIRVLASVGDSATLQRHVLAGGGSVLLLSRQFAADPVAALDLLPERWAAVVFCGGAGRFATVLCRRAGARAHTRVLCGARLVPVVLDRALRALASELGALKDW